MEKQESKGNLNKGITLFVVVAMSFMATLDSSIVNVVLPVMSEKMDVPLSSIEWVVAIYSIIICSTLLFFGRVGDILGKTKIFQYGSILFTLASLMCGLCHSFVPLVICRLIQGIGASAYMATNQGIIAEMYPKEKRGKALGILMAAVALGTMVGPPAGGFILSVLSWNYIFLINVPIGIVIFLLGTKYLPKSKGNKEKLDVKGAILLFGGTLLLFGALIESQQIGFLNPFILGSILISVILIFFFVRLEQRVEQPLLELNILKNFQFSINLFCALLLFICIAASIIIVPFYLQNVLKLTPLHTGFFMMISPLVLAVLSPFCGNLSDKIGSEIMTVVGLFFMAVGFFFMSRLVESSTIIECAVSVIVVALGQALFQPANNSLIMSSCPRNKLGIVGSINALVRNLGLISGITLSTTLLYKFMSMKINYHVVDYVKGRDDVFVYGMKHVYLIIVGICIIGFLITAYRLYQVKTKIEIELNK